MEGAVSLKAVFRTIARNDQLVWIAVIFLIQQVGNGLVNGGIGSTYIYFTFGYDGGLYSLFTMVGMSATAFLMIFYPAISRRLHRKKLLGIMAVLAVSGYGLMLVSLPVPGNGMGKFGLLTEEQKLAEISGIIFGTTGGKYGGVQAGQSTGLLITMTVAPCVLMLLSYYLYKKKYKLDEEEYDRICRDLGKV